MHCVCLGCTVCRFNECECPSCVEFLSRSASREPGREVATQTSLTKALNSPLSLPVPACKDRWSWAPTNHCLHPMLYIVAVPKGGFYWYTAYRSIEDWLFTKLYKIDPSFFPWHFCNEESGTCFLDVWREGFFSYFFTRRTRNGRCQMHNVVYISLLFYISSYVYWILSESTWEGAKSECLCCSLNIVLDIVHKTISEVRSL